MLEPSQARVIQPFRGRDVQNVPHHTQCQIDGLGLDAGFLAHFDERLQSPDVNRAKLQIADEWIQLLQVQCFIANSFLVLVLVQVLGGRLSKSAFRSLPVDQRLACLFDSLG